MTPLSWCASSDVWSQESGGVRHLALHVPLEAGTGLFSRGCHALHNEEHFSRNSVDVVSAYYDSEK